jgi:hypothetical protein
VRKNATGLVAKIKDKLKVTPVEEKGQPGQLDVFVGDERLAAPTGVFAKVFNKTQKVFFAEVEKRMGAT